MCLRSQDGCRRFQPSATSPVHASAGCGDVQNAIHQLGSAGVMPSGNRPAGEAISLVRAIEIAASHHQAGRLSEAENIYRQVLAFDPDNFDALHLLGVVALQLQRHSDAVALIERAMERQPESAQALSNLGLAYRGHGDLDRARAAFEQAIALDPAFIGARSNLALVLQAQGNATAAMEQLRAVIADQPGNVEALHNLAGLLQEQGCVEAAVPLYDQAIALVPNFAEAHFNRARALDRLRRRPEAIAGYQKALSLKPDLPGPNYCLATLLYTQGLTVEAIDCLEQEIRNNPESVEARWALAMAQLAGVYGAGEASGDYRAAFDTALTELDGWLTGDRIGGGCHTVGSYPPFYLAYDEQNNKELLSRYGDLCARLMNHWQDTNGLVCGHGHQCGPVRVGIISGHIRKHSVWTAIVKGWLQSIDAARVSLHVFHTGDAEDEETNWAKARAASYDTAGSGLADFVQAILARNLDAIIFPEVGMDPMTIMLASMRLAPVQIAAWGHPETSGLPTVDYFLSAECFEPADAQENYRERLVTMPNLGCHYRRLDITPEDPDLRALGLDPTRPILVCPGTPYKYRPEYDGILLEIARGAPSVQLVFFSYSNCVNQSEVLRLRLARAFRQARLRFDDCVRFIPWLSSQQFFGLLQHTTACLDTVGFSGFNTAMQVIQCGVPLVTLEGRFMRGRFGSGIMRRMGLGELVATSNREYADLAVRLATDAGFRERTRARIVAARGVLFDDVVPVRALEDFLVDVTRSSRVDHW
ncbi:MAG: tetratricopeptide repeat protein [Burkholderiales bacterium]|nr:tetratricopeptide repeat protein [Burkholderiales bacterium]